MDKHTPEQRHKNMKAIKCKNSQIEKLLRSELWKRGLRYRKNVSVIMRYVYAEEKEIDLMACNEAFAKERNHYMLKL